MGGDAGRSPTASSHTWTRRHAQALNWKAARVGRCGAPSRPPAPLSAVAYTMEGASLTSQAERMYEDRLSQLSGSRCGDTQRERWTQSHLTPARCDSSSGAASAKDYGAAKGPWTKTEDERLIGLVRFPVPAAPPTDPVRHADSPLPLPLAAGEQVRHQAVVGRGGGPSWSHRQTVQGAVDEHP